MYLKLILAVLLFCNINAKTQPKFNLAKNEWRMNLFGATPTTEKCEKVELIEEPYHVGGYIDLPNTKDGHLFYMYFENRYRDPNAPLLFWTNGGPGCSSLFGLFEENGPYKIQEDMSLCWNDYGWDIGHNIVFVDQPLGTGYSYTGSKSDDVPDEETVATDILYFFLEFFEIHPELASKDLYLSGESFAGHYLPSIAHKMINANKTKKDKEINLRGIVMGNPYVSPSQHYKSYPEFSYLNKLITKQQADDILNSWPTCDTSLSVCDPTQWYFVELLCILGVTYCQLSMFEPILNLNPDLNYYDIRAPCVGDLCYDETLLTNYLNLPEVKKELGVPQEMKWEECSTDVYFDLLWDLASDKTPAVVNILDAGIDVIVYVGDQDLICNYIGNYAWMDIMEWPKQDTWQKTSLSVWYADGSPAGEFKQVDNLTYLTVYNAGHMVPMDQPKVSLSMITTAVSPDKKWDVKHKSNLYSVT